MDTSWGIRDVNGPYLKNNKGYINLGDNLLSPTAPSTVTLVFALSNRCPVPAMKLRVSVGKNVVVHSVNKNGSAEFVFDDLKHQSKEGNGFVVDVLDENYRREHVDFSEIFSITELTIER